MEFLESFEDCIYEIKSTNPGSKKINHGREKQFPEFMYTLALFYKLYAASSRDIKRHLFPARQIQRDTSYLRVFPCQMDQILEDFRGWQMK